MQTFSLNESILQDILCHARPLGHNEKPHNLNLGFGFLYYGLVRALRPRHVVVIGSGFGFSVVCLALGLKDNGSGHLNFIDPAYSLLADGPFKTIGGTGKWNSPEGVQEHFRSFGVEEIVTHHKMTSEAFFQDFESLHLPAIDLGFIDGNHSFKDVRADFRNVLRHTRKNSYVFLHDTNIYIREFLGHSGVKRWLDIIKRDEEYFEAVNFPFASGVALVRIVKDKAWKSLQ